MAYDQSKRILAITTILGPNKVLLTELEGHDELSQPFLFKIRMATEEGPSSVQGLLGTEVTLEFGLPVDPDAPTVGVERRKFRGFIRRISRGFFSVGGMTEWQAEVVPKLWFLSRSADVKIYQDLTTNDIIQQVVNKFGISKQLNANSRGMTALDLCVQYRESALDFVSRLMEKEGLFYFHDHTDSTTTLKIVDMNASCPAWALDPVPLHGHRSRGSVWRFDEEYAVQTGKWATRDFDFNGVMTQDNVQPTTLGSLPGMSTDHEVYDYPGAYGEKWMAPDTIGLLTTGSGLTRVAIEREEAKYHRRRGASDISLLDPGRRLKLSADGLTDPEVLITSVHHRAMDYSHWTDSMWGDRPRQEPFYENEFTCIPQSVPFRPEIRAPRPFVRGPQTAIVVGDGDIHTDKYGRVQVQFHWDRDNAAASVWVRVSQGWAGAGFGQIHIPRVGEEVVVDFLEGDPDRPLITGRLYNSNNMPPYSLPANKTQYGIKTNSVDASGSNELRFEDKGGSEQIYVHAQKDLDSVVENNETRHVKVDRKTNIDANETSTIGGNKKTDVTGNFDEKVMGKETRQVMGAVSETFMATETRKVMGAFDETIMGSMKQTVIGGLTFMTPQTITCTAIGGITFTAPGGFKVLAPGGTQTVDSWFKSIGGMNEDQFGMAIALNASKLDVNGLATARVVTKVENVTTTIAKGEVAMSDVLIELDKEELHLLTSNSVIQRAAVTLLM